MAEPVSSINILLWSPGLMALVREVWEPSPKHLENLMQFTRSVQSDLDLCHLQKSLFSPIAQTVEFLTVQLIRNIWL